MRRLTRALLGIALFASVALAVQTHFARRAEALCLAQTEDGAWRNADANTRGPARVELEFICQDQVRNGELYPPGPPWKVRVWGRCHPTNCDWGQVGAQRLSSGHIYATYNQGFARRYVYARMSQYQAGRLWVYTYTDFTSPSRADYGRHDWFDRE